MYLHIYVNTHYPKHKPFKKKRARKHLTKLWTKTTLHFKSNGL